MTEYEICWSDGRREVHGSYGEALDAITEARGTDVEIGHDGDLTEGGDRTLVWASEEDAEGDDGRKAIAAIREVQ